MKKTYNTKKDTSTLDCFGPELIPIRDAMITAVTNIIVGVSKLGNQMTARQFMEAATALNRAWELYEKFDGDEKKIIDVTWGDARGDSTACNTKLN
jgi:hypothetical protein